MSEEHPYVSLENTPLWEALDRALAELEENSDLELTTARHLVIGYLAKQLASGRSVWVFNGTTNHFPSAVFTSHDAADGWVKEHKLTGTLTEYPLDVSVYDWAVSTGFFKPKADSYLKIANFSSASQVHVHYSEGEED